MTQIVEQLQQALSLRKGMGLIVTAAIAKAELAKRWWYTDATCSTFRLYYSNPEQQNRHDFTDIYSFDETDPKSEAEAIIKACLEALELEA